MPSKKGSWKVTLTKVDESRCIPSLKCLRELCIGLGLKEAKDIYDLVKYSRRPLLLKE